MNLVSAIEQLRIALRRQHKAPATESNYVYWVRRYAAFLGRLPVTLPSEQKLERFLSGLAYHRDLSASTQNQAFNAILYFYREVWQQPLQNVDALRARRPKQLRHAPSVSQTQALLQSVPNVGGYPTNLIARLLYGCGLRVSEPLNLRTKDVSLERHSLFIRGAKGGKDRVVPLPISLLAELRQQLEAAKAVWHADQHNHIPVLLPLGLARKYPHSQFAWQWAWLFPAHNICAHPHTRTPVRYRMHEVNVQRAIKLASRKLGLTVLPHELRHGYATHCLERGISPRAIQQVMGHSSLETTMGYLHAESLGVLSPLDATMGQLRASPSATTA